MNEIDAVARERDADYRLYFRLMSEGIEHRTVHEFVDEMEVIALNTPWPKLKDACYRAMTRYDNVEVVRTPRLLPAVLPPTSANSR